MNKLGFYVENTTVQFLRDALRQVQPPTMLLHAGDRGLLQEMRAGLSPDTFIVGRMFVDLAQQNAWLTAGDPEAHGRAFAETILKYDFGYAKEKGQNGRLLVDAWMSLNESVRGPASFADGKPDAETKARYTALDRFQVAFLQRLRSDGLEAVAFNFAAGNFTRPEHYLDFFPRTLEAYTYLGFHEYGWPTMMPRVGTETGAGLFLPCLEAFRARYGSQHKVIITEAGLARMYKYPHGPGGDVGWLYAGDPINEEQYWESLLWYNNQLRQQDAVLGCCLFSVGHTGGWLTFRHLGQDNQLKPITLISRIESLRKASITPTPTPEPEPKPTENPAALLARIAAVKQNASAALAQADTFLAELTAARQMLDGLAQIAGKAPTADDVRNLHNRLQALEARLDQLPAGTSVDVAALRAGSANLRGQTQALLPDGQARDAIAERLVEARTTLTALTARTADVTALKTSAEALLAQADALSAEIKLKIAPPSVTPQPQPNLSDKRNTLPARAGAGYPTRTLGAIKRIIIHHTVTRGDVTPERLAEAHVGRGKPGITYHFVVSDTGAITWTQPLEVAVEQTLSAAANTEGIGVALAGNFQEQVPPAAQMDGAAVLIAWLLSTLGLPVNAVIGRSEVDIRIASPGAQWSQGAQYKGTLLNAISGVLAGVQ